MLELLCVWEFIPLGGIKLILFEDRKKFSLRPVEAKSLLNCGIISFERSGTMIVRKENNTGR